MKPHYHVNLTNDMKQDMQLWQKFLTHPTAYSRPFLDFTHILTAQDVDLYTDASGVIGCGGIFCERWYQMERSHDFIKKFQPSIEYLELFAVTAAVLMWSDSELLMNRRICLFCDNKSVCGMINRSSSNCKNCMVLVRKNCVEGTNNKHKSIRKNM